MLNQCINRTHDRLANFLIMPNCQRRIIPNGQNKIISRWQNTWLSRHVFRILVKLCVLVKRHVTIIAH